NFGIFITGNPPAAGHVIENNLLWFNRSVGIRLDGAAGIVRHNTVTNTGGQPGSLNGIGIVVNGSVDVIDNVVDGVTGDGSVAFTPYGITAGDNNSVGSLIRGNRVRNLTPNGSGSATGIQNRWYGVRLAGVGSVVRGNIVTNTGRLPNAD